MVATLNGIAFDQVYGDNSGGAEFDTDADGTATQEDEFVSFINTTGAAVDISGWEVWGEASGGGAPDVPQSGLYHIFPPGTVLQPGDSIYVINEITGTPKSWAQEASEGGTESGAGGVPTNLLGEGHENTDSSLALVDPVSGDYLVFNMYSGAERVSEMSGFTGTTEVGIIDGASVVSDQNAGSSYQYNSGTDSYTYSAVYVPCFAAGARIQTPTGYLPVETLAVGDLVMTLDNGPQPIRAISSQSLVFKPRQAAGQQPILFRAGCFGPGVPFADLELSPQHRVLLSGAQCALAPARAFTAQRGVRKKKGCRKVRYVHLVLERHEILFANGMPCESYLIGAYGGRRHPKVTSLLSRLAPRAEAACRPLVGVRAARALLKSHTPRILPSSARSRSGPPILAPASCRIRLDASAKVW